MNAPHADRAPSRGARAAGRGERISGPHDNVAGRRGKAREGQKTAGEDREPGRKGGLAAGLRATITHQVGEADTAIALGSGDVPVLGTPRLLALAEAACVAAVEPHIRRGQTTVGTSVTLEHKRPSPLGTPVEVEAELTRVDGRRLGFVFIAYGPGTGEDAVVGAGTVERVLVDRNRFLDRAGVTPRG